MPLLYFAAPLFSESELAFNAALTAEIERLGFTVFLPQRDGVGVANEPWASMPAAEVTARSSHRSRRGSRLRRAALRARWAGARRGRLRRARPRLRPRAATGRRRALIGLMTDRRGASIDGKFNPMIGERARRGLRLPRRAARRAGKAGGLAHLRPPLSASRRGAW